MIEVLYSLIEQQYHLLKYHSLLFNGLRITCQKS